MELFDICDEQGNPTGDIVERSEAHEKAYATGLPISG